MLCPLAPWPRTDGLAMIRLVPVDARYPRRLGRRIYQPTWRTHAQCPTMLAAVLVMSFVLTACTSDALGPVASPSPSPSPSPEASISSTAVEDFANLEGFASEYDEAASELSSTLPDGATIPDAPIGEWDPEGQFEPGAGEMQAAFVWQCAWINAYVDAKTRSDQGAIDKSLAQLEGWTELSLVKTHIDDESRKVWADEVITSARHGDDSFLLSVGADCMS